jgi:predicted N-formylglutamate amidohydrolase
VMLEIRNDLLGTTACQAEIGEWLAGCVSQALAVAQNAGGREFA